MSATSPPLLRTELRSDIELRAAERDDTLAIPVLLAGGAGSRLWPLSRTGHPKQFLGLHEEHASLFQQAVERLQSLAGDGMRLGPLLAVVNEEHRFLCLDQLRRTRSESAVLLMEPCGRNTAAALTLAALQAALDGTDPVLFASPADQVVLDADSFQAAARAAIREAAIGSLVVLGIPPTHPETGYGYIQADVPQEGVTPVRRFVEKPDLATARRLLDEGNFYRNSGSFTLRASVWLGALETLRPDIAAATRTAFALRTMDDPFVRPDRAASCRHSRRVDRPCRHGARSEQRSRAAHGSSERWLERPRCPGGDLDRSAEGRLRQCQPWLCLVGRQP